MILFYFVELRVKRMFVDFVFIGMCEYVMIFKTFKTLLISILLMAIDHNII